MPGGFKVVVRILGKDEAKDEMGGQVLAQYMQEEHIILLKKIRSRKNRKSDLEHELHHVCIDWIDFYVRKSTI